jgi:hypothetical protein
MLDTIFINVRAPFVAVAHPKVSWGTYSLVFLTGRSPVLTTVAFRYVIEWQFIIALLKERQESACSDSSRVTACSAWRVEWWNAVAGIV